MISHLTWLHTTCSDWLVGVGGGVGWGWLGLVGLGWSSSKQSPTNDKHRMIYQQYPSAYHQKNAVHPKKQATPQKIRAAPLTIVLLVLLPDKWESMVTYGYIVTSSIHCSSWICQPTDATRVMKLLWWLTPLWNSRAREAGPDECGGYQSLVGFEEPLTCRNVCWFDPEVFFFFGVGSILMRMCMDMWRFLLVGMSPFQVWMHHVHPSTYIHAQDAEQGSQERVWAVYKSL